MKRGKRANRPTYSTLTQLHSMWMNKHFNQSQIERERQHTALTIKRTPHPMNFPLSIWQFSSLEVPLGCSSHFQILSSLWWYFFCLLETQRIYICLNTPFQESTIDIISVSVSIACTFIHILDCAFTHYLFIVIMIYSSLFLNHYVGQYEILLLISRFPYVLWTLIYFLLAHSQAIWIIISVKPYYLGGHFSPLSPLPGYPLLFGGPFQPFKSTTRVYYV